MTESDAKDDHADGRPDVDLDDVDRFLVEGGSGDTIYAAGDAASHLYLIEEGEVEIRPGDGTAGEPLDRLGPGDVFGESALVEDEPRDTVARAVGEYRLLRIEPPVFRQLVRERPEIAGHVIHRLGSRLLRHLEEAAEPGPADGEERKPAPETDAAEPQGAELAGPAVLADPDSDRELPLEIDAPGSESVVGRADPNREIFPDVDLTELDSHRTVSRRHATILRREDGYFLREEEGVANGTFVDGERIEAGVAVPLQPGASLRFGNVELVFRAAS